MGRLPWSDAAIPTSRVPLHRRWQVPSASLRWWLAAAGLAALVGTLVADAHHDAEQARRRWGTTVTVWVTERAVPAGAPLRPAVAPVRWPVALAPPGRVGTVAAGARAAADLGAGVPVVRGAVRGAGRPRPGATVAIPAGAGSVAAAVGDRVDLWATGDPAVAGAGPQTRRVARRARVVAVGDDAITVAVGVTEVAAVARAAATATVTVVGEG